MLTQANIIVISFSEDAFNAILSVAVAFLGVSLSLLTLSVAFVVSGKSANSELKKHISESGISIGNREQFLRNKSATTFMTLIAKRSLAWLIINIVATITFLLLVITPFIKVESIRDYFSLVSIIYFLISGYFLFVLMRTVLLWYNKHIK